MSTVKGVWKFRPQLKSMEDVTNVYAPFEERVKFKWFPCEFPAHETKYYTTTYSTYYYEDDFSGFKFVSSGQIGCMKKIVKQYNSGGGGQTTYPSNDYKTWYIRYSGDDGLCWQNGSLSEPMFVDFGEEEQTVSDKFYAWLINNAVEQIPVECSYKGVTTPLDRGHISTLKCKDKYAVDDIKIKGSPLISWFEYNEKRTYIDNDETKILPCGGKKMRSDIVVNTIKEYPEMFTYNVNIGSSKTTLRAEIQCYVGDLVVAAIATRDTLTLSDGWTLVSTSGTNSTDTNNQRLSWAWKIAESTTESITVTQASEQRLYINMVALQGATGVVDSGYSYLDEAAGSLTISKPEGLVLWGMTAPVWSTTTPYVGWKASNSMPIIQSDGYMQQRLGLGLDQSEDENVTFISAADSTTMIVGCLTVQGMDKFY